jgi:hypothetical protein
MRHSITPGPGTSEARFGPNKVSNVRLGQLLSSPSRSIIALWRWSGAPEVLPAVQRRLKRKSIRDGHRGSPVPAALWVVLVCLGGLSRNVFGQAGISVERSLEEAQSAMLQRHYGEAIRVLKMALAAFPGDNSLRVELGRAYVYHGRGSSRHTPVRGRSAPGRRKPASKAGAGSGVRL